MLRRVFKMYKKQTRARRMLNLLDDALNANNGVIAGPSHATDLQDEDPEEPFSPVVSEYVPSSESSDSEDLLPYDRYQAISCTDIISPTLYHSALEALSSSPQVVDNLDNLCVINENQLTPSQHQTNRQSNFSTPESFRVILASVTSQSQNSHQEPSSTQSESVTSTSNTAEVIQAGRSIFIASYDTIYINNDDVQNFTTQKGRKRVRNEKLWQRNISKKLKNSGKAYISVNTKKQQLAKTLRDPCLCKKKCYETLTYEDRKSVFDFYWKLGDHERQWDFIVRFVHSKPKRVEVLNAKNPRTQSLVYSLPKQNKIDVVIVCKIMFLRTLDINEKIVYKAIEKHESESVVDLRGKHSSRSIKYSTETVNSVMAHINLFPRKESHYLRAQTQRQYLCETLNRAKMYRLYREWISDNSDYQNVTPANEKFYVHIFNTRFNLGFFCPKKDMCDICSIFENADEERKEQLRVDYDSHIKNKETVRKLKDIEKSNSDPKIKTVACFDLEKVLSIPQSPVGIFHYKRKFPVLNFTVYDVLQQQGYCYMWHAQIGNRGANEIASCLWIFLKHESARGIKEVSLYSDNCTGQNRNRFVYAMYLYAAKELNIKITHRFLQKGHTQNEGDSMHSVIEKNKKHQVLFVPDQLYALVRNAKVNGNKYVVQEMTRQDFFNFKLLVDNTKNWSHDIDKDKIYWNKIKEISVSPDDPGKFFLKYEYESDPIIVDTNTKASRPRNRKTIAALTNSHEPPILTLAYNEPLKISKNLFKDLLSLCDSNAIPLHYQTFYRNLVPNNDSQPNESDEE